MRVLVTGGAGFVGSHIVDRLLRDGHPVSTVDNLSAGRAANVNPAARLIVTDIRSARLSAVVAEARPDAVVHVAAQAAVARSVVDPVFDASVNLLGTLTLLEASRRAGVRRVVYTSTGGAAYGDTDVLPTPEDHPARATSPYGVSKVAAERYLECWAGLTGGSVLSLRLANVYGPRQNPLGEAGVIAIALYDALATAERDDRLAEVYRRLANVERRHAERWRSKLEEGGEKLPDFAPSWRTRTLGWLARRFGTGVVLPTVQTLEKTDTNKYKGQADARDFHGDERSHSRVIQLMSSMRGGFAGSDVARIEGRHRTAGGNALRAAVLGANDGLVSNLSLVMGVAGAAMSERAILITGLAGLLAGAGSMALGEWLSVQSSRELYRHQLETEEEELMTMPEEEEEELALIYQARGLGEQQAREFASSMMRNPDTALETLAREELGFDPEELGGSPWEAAIASFLLFAFGAVVPVIPYFFARGDQAVLLSIAFSTLALFAVGAAITLFTGRTVLVSGLRQVLFGLIAAGLTFGLGRLVGVSLE